jgi:hypothetical protein
MSENEKANTDETTVITGRENIEMTRILAVRSALKLETKGMRMSRGRSARALANEITGSRARTATAAYDSLNTYIVGRLGEAFDRPLRPATQDEDEA